MYNYKRKTLPRGPEVDIHCAIYTRTGRCNNFGKCRYKHAPKHRALCQSFLKTGECTKKGRARCYLLHELLPQNTPMCIHFARGKCDKTDCQYTHMMNIQQSGPVPVCRSFALNGWCENGSLCSRKHVFECPDFNLYQKCSNKSCKLAHVIKKPEVAKTSVSNSLVLVEDFINFLKTADPQQFLASLLPHNDGDSQGRLENEVEQEMSLDGEDIDSSNESESESVNGSEEADEAEVDSESEVSHTEIDFDDDLIPV